MIKRKYKELLKRAFENVIPFDYDTIADIMKDADGNVTLAIRSNLRGSLDKFMA